MCRTHPAWVLVLHHLLPLELDTATAATLQRLSFFASSRSAACAFSSSAALGFIEFRKLQVERFHPLHQHGRNHAGAQTIYGWRESTYHGACAVAVLRMVSS